MELYHLSKNDSLKFLSPRIPKCAVDMYEELTTPRVCFATSIDGCLSAIQEGDCDLYVYIPANSNLSCYIPSAHDVIDAPLTGEVWVLHDVEVVCIGKIRVTDMHKCGKEINVTNRYGEPDTTCFHYYEWCWLERW